MNETEESCTDQWQKYAITPMKYSLTNGTRRMEHD